MHVVDGPLQARRHELLLQLRPAPRQQPEEGAVGKDTQPPSFRHLHRKVKY